MWRKIQGVNVQIVFKFFCNNSRISQPTLSKFSRETFFNIWNRNLYIKSHLAIEGPAFAIPDKCFLLTKSFDSVDYKILTGRQKKYIW